MRPEASIVLPTYNEKENIAVLIPRLESMIKKEGLRAEIIVVDDSSPDRTAEAAKELGKKYGNIRVIVRRKKEGIGPALKEGYSNAQGKIIASIDVDSFSPSDVIRLVKKVREGHDMVVGSRYKGMARYEKKRLKTHIKHVISVSGNKLTRVLTGIDVSDYSLNCRAMTKECWEKISEDIAEKGSAMLLEMIWHAHRKGFKVTDIPVIFKDRRYGKSKMNLLKQPLVFFHTLIRLVLKER